MLAPIFALWGTTGYGLLAVYDHGVAARVGPLFALGLLLLWLMSRWARER